MAIPDQRRKIIAAGRSPWFRRRGCIGAERDGILYGEATAPLHGVRTGKGSP